MPNSIDEIITLLNTIIEACKAEGSRKGYFPVLYKRVTTEVKNKISENYFEDNERMGRLLVLFAGRYLEAHDQYQKGEPCTNSWKVAFDATSSWRPLVLQHIFLGMNAHISLDLGIAATSISPGNSIGSLKNDFYKINSILAFLTDRFETELEEIFPILKPIDWIAGHLDEDLAAFSINIARDAAWQMALHLASLQQEIEKEKFIRQRDRDVAAFAMKLYRPKIILSGIISLFRLGETGTVKSKIEKLEK